MDSERFKPVRAGIVGVWDYDDHVFCFADGRLVLRGPNGSGKTKALEVLVPFVFDGSIDPRRLDPFSGQQRTMKSNLLYGGQTTGQGYCWLELAKGDEVVTVGVGMRAHETSARVKRWWFVVEGRVGEELQLVERRGDKSYALGRSQLIEQLGRAAVSDSVEAHQRAVDNRLFGLGAERYRDMLELVLTLRRPQLAKDLDLEQLSVVLSEGLRTVDPELLRDSAEAFVHLEEARRRLVELEQARLAVDAVLTAWRTWLRARAAQRCAEVARVRARLDGTEAKVAMLERRIQAKAREASAAAQRVADHDTDSSRLAAILDGLRRSRAYQDQGQLEDKRESVAQAQTALARAERQAERSRSSGAQAGEEREQAEQRLDKVRSQVDEGAAALRGLLRELRLEAEGPLEHGALGATLVARDAAVAAVLEVVEKLEAVEAQLLQAETVVQRSLAELEQAQGLLDGAQAELERCLAQAAVALDGWHAGLLGDLRALVDLGVLHDALPELGRGARLDQRVREQLATLRDQTTEQLHGLATQLAGCEAGRDERLALIEEIRSQRQDAPPAGPTHSAPRQDRPGAPLWRLVRFRSEVDEGQRAGLEGALLAAGLLDAWVDPPDLVGEVDPHRQDSALRPTRPHRGPTLSSVLEPEEQEQVPHRLVVELLDAIALEPAEVSALPDGRFQLGPLVGAHSPTAARFIGATARARHRAERIAALEAECRELDDQIRVLGLERQVQIDLRLAIDRAPEGLPAGGPVRAAREAQERASGRREQAQRALHTAQDQRDRHARQREQARHALLTAARTHGTPTEPAVLRALQRSLAAARRSLAQVVHLSESLAERQREHELAQARWARAIEAQQAAEGDRDEARDTHAGTAAELQTLEQTLGVEVRQVLAQIKRHAAEQQALRGLRKEAEEERQDAAGARLKFEGEQDAERRKLPELEEDLTRARARLRPLEHPDVVEVLAVAAGDEDFAERLDRACDGASFSDEQLKSTETRFRHQVEGLDRALGSRFRSTRYDDDGIVRLTLQDERGPHGPAAFAELLEQRLLTARQLMASHEQKLFEDQLLGNLCTQLRERVDETRELVEAMDSAMRQRRLASGKSVGISWRSRPDTPPQRRELLELLGFEAALLGPERLGRVRSLLREEVQRIRREHPDRGYHPILMEALDYRAWHHFELTLHEPDGRSARLGKRRHGQLSGGEKAATLHLPLFAAAHAHFSAGRPDCPRLVALDEAFAGIDDTGVPELLRLAHAFDLDWFLTGYDLWVTEPFLPAVMHYDLAHDPVSRAVSAWPILWNGRETVEGDDALPALDAQDRTEP